MTVATERRQRREAGASARLDAWVSAGSIPPYNERGGCVRPANWDVRRDFWDVRGMYAEIVYGGTRDVRWDVRWVSKGYADVVRISTNFVRGLRTNLVRGYAGMSYGFRT